MSGPTNATLPGIWMRLKDRKKLKKLMVLAEPEVSARQLANAAGWKSHTYMNRLLAGEENTLKVEPAVRIAKHLGVRVDDLFVPTLSSEAGQISQEEGAA